MSNFLLSGNLVYVPTVLSSRLCLAVCFPYSNSFTKLTPDGYTYRIFVRVCFQLPRSEMNIWYTQVVKIGPISWCHVKELSFLSLDVKLKYGKVACFRNKHFGSQLKLSHFLGSKFLHQIPSKIKIMLGFYLLNLFWSNAKM